MKRCVVAFVACLLVQAAAPAPARANIWRWIDELSGPGPFHGYQYEWRVVCGGRPGSSERKQDDKRSLLFALGGIGPCLIDRVPKNDRRVWSVNTSVGWFSATRNPLLPDAAEDRRKVDLTTFEATVMWQPYVGVDVGTGVGVYWFGGAAFDSFSRTALLPLRVDARPAELINRDVDKSRWWWTAMLGARFDVAVIPRGFDAADFGAPPRRFASRDTLTNWAVMIDLEPLARKILGN